MKKFLITCLLLAPIAVYAEKDMGVNVPEWKDFAPQAYADIKAPKGLGKLSSTNCYWYDRKVEFENDLETCRSLENSDERFSCYEKLKFEQYKMNNDYNAKLEAKIYGTTSIPGMENRVDNMQPIGNYLNNTMRWIPNEVR